MGSRTAPPAAGDNPPATAPAAVSKADESAMKAVAASSELGKKGDTIPYREKLRRAREVADSIDVVIPLLKDPAQMMGTAAAIIEYGIQQDVNSLEYWGEDPVTQAHLKPLTSAVIKLFAAASKTADKRAAELANLDLKIQKNADAWAAMDELAHNADYTRLMSTYFDCIATNPKVYIDPKTKAVLTPEEVRERNAKKKVMISLRKSMADGAIKGLAEYDNKDTEVQPRIRIMIAKLHMASGDYKKAKEVFFSVYKDKSDLAPAPNPYEQFEARYFFVVAEVLGGELAGAIKDEQSLDAWQMTKFPALLKKLKEANGKPILDDAAIKKTVESLESAEAMLQWRVWELASDLAPNADAKKAAEASAEGVLMKLRAAHPELAARIDQQLVNRFPADRIVDDTVPPSVLLALVKRGMIESYKTEPDKTDEAVLKKAIEAARVIVKNKDRKNPEGKTEFTPQNISDSRLAIAEFRESLGNDVQAANDYLDYAVEYHPVEPTRAQEALERAGYLIFAKMTKGSVKPKGYEQLYDRFLPIAINPPFNRANLAYLYAERLRDRKEFELALKYYRLTPKDSPSYGLVDYKVMVVLDELLQPDNAKTLDDGVRKQMIEELKSVAARVKRLGDNPKDDLERKKALVATRILEALAAGPEADVAKRLNEKRPSTLNGRAGMVLVRAMIRAGQIEDAIQKMDELLAASTENEQVVLVRDLIEELEMDYPLKHDHHRRHPCSRRTWDRGRFERACRHGDASP